jgi:rubrerythrin
MSGIENIKDAIGTAIQMEKEGHAFYKKCAEQTKSDLGARIFESIAGDELVHLMTFHKMFEDQIGNEELEAVEKTGKKYETPPVFPKDLEAVEGSNADVDELAALEIAMKSEQDAIDFYGKMRDETEDENVKKIIDLIIGQEKSHYLILSEELSYMNTMGDWYDLGPQGV